MKKRKRQQNAHLRASWGKGSGITMGNQNSAFRIHFLLNPPPHTQQRKGWVLSLKLQILTQSELLCYLKCKGLDESTIKTTLIPHHRLSLSPRNSAKAFSNRTVEHRHTTHLKSLQQLPASPGAIHKIHTVTKHAVDAFYFRFQKTRRDGRAEVKTNFRPPAGRGWRHRICAPRRRRPKSSRIWPLLPSRGRQETVWMLALASGAGFGSRAGQGFILLGLAFPLYQGTD